MFPTARSLAKMIFQTGIQLQHLSVTEISTNRAHASRGTFLFDLQSLLAEMFVVPLLVEALKK